MTTWPGALGIDESCPDGTACAAGFCVSDSERICVVDPDAAPTPPDAATPDANIPPLVPLGLVGYWAFDEQDGDVAIDGVGENDGALVGGPVRIVGQVGGALAFDGTDDRVAIGNPPELNLVGAISMAAWIRWDGNGDTLQSVLAHGFSDAPVRSVYLRINRNDNEYEAGSFDGIEHQTNEGPIRVDEWVHIAQTYDGAVWHMYFNGLEVDINTDTVGALAVASPWAIGARGVGGARHFSGAIDEVRIYNRALNVTEVGILAGQ